MIRKKWFIKNEEDFYKIYNKIISIWKKILTLEKILNKYGEKIKNMSKAELEKIKKNTKITDNESDIFRSWFLYLENNANKKWSDISSELINLLDGRFSNKEKNIKLMKLIELENNIQNTLLSVNDVFKNDNLSISLWIQSFNLNEIDKVFDHEYDKTIIEQWKLSYEKEYTTLDIWNWKIYLIPDWWKYKLKYIEVDSKTWKVIIIKEKHKVYKIINKNKKWVSFTYNISKNIVSMDIWDLKWLWFIWLNWKVWKNNSFISFKLWANFNIEKTIFWDKKTALNFWFNKSIINSWDIFNINLWIKQNITDKLYAWIWTSYNIDNANKILQYLSKKWVLTYNIWYKNLNNTWWDANIKYNQYLANNTNYGIWINFERNKQNIQNIIKKSKENLSSKDIKDILKNIYPQGDVDLILPKAKKILQNKKVREKILGMIDSVWINFSFVDLIYNISLTLWIVYDVKLMKRLIPWNDKLSLEIRKNLLSMSNNLKNIRLIDDIKLEDLSVWNNKYKIIPDNILNKIIENNSFKTWDIFFKANIYISPELQKNIKINEDNTFSLENWVKVAPNIFEEYTLDWWVILNIYFWENIIGAEVDSKYMYSTWNISSFKNFSFKKFILNINTPDFIDNLSLKEKEQKWNEILWRNAIINKILNENNQDIISVINNINSDKNIKKIDKIFWDIKKEYNLSDQFIVETINLYLLKKEKFDLKNIDKKKIKEWFEKIQKLASKLWINIDYSFLFKNALKSKEKKELNWGIAFAIMNNWINSFDISDLVLNNVVTKEIKKNWYIYRIVFWLKDSHPIISIQTEKDLSIWKHLLTEENVKKTDVYEIKELLLSLWYIFKPPHFRSKYIDIKVSSKKYESNKWIISKEFYWKKEPTLEDIFSWKLKVVKTYSNLLWEKNYKQDKNDYIPWVKQLSKENLISNKFKIVDKENSIIEDKDWKKYILEYSKSWWFYKLYDPETWLARMLDKNWNKILTFNEYIDKKGWLDINYLLNQNGKEAMQIKKEYIKYLAKNLDNNYKIDFFIRHYIKYTSDKKVSSTFSNYTTYEVHYNWNTILDHTDKNWNIMDDCDGYASLLHEIFKEQGRKSVILWAFWWGGWHAFVQTYNIDKNGNIKTISYWTWWANWKDWKIITDKSIADATKDSFDKYWFMNDNDKKYRSQHLTIYDKWLSTDQKNNGVYSISINSNELNKDKVNLLNTLEFLQDIVDNKNQWEIDKVI